MQPPTTGSALDNTTWALQEYGAPQNLTVLGSDATVTLAFANGKVAGNAGCNRYFAEVTVNGDQLTIGAAGTTRMMCPEPLMQLETAYLAALQQAERFTLSGDQLDITCAGGATLLRFTKQP